MFPMPGGMSGGLSGTADDPGQPPSEPLWDGSIGAPSMPQSHQQMQIAGQGGKGPVGSYGSSLAALSRHGVREEMRPEGAFSMELNNLVRPQLEERLRHLQDVEAWRRADGHLTAANLAGGQNALSALMGGVGGVPKPPWMTAQPGLNPVLQAQLLALQQQQQQQQLQQATQHQQSLAALRRVGMGATDDGDDEDDDQDDESGDEKYGPRLGKQEKELLQMKFMEWEGSLMGRGKEVQDVADRLQLTVDQLARRFKSMRRKLFKAAAGVGRRQGKREREESLGDRFDGPSSAMEPSFNPMGGGAMGGMNMMSFGRWGQPSEAAMSAARRQQQSSGKKLPGEVTKSQDSDSEKEEDRKRKWMTKEQAKACQQKFDEWGGSLRGRQEEVAVFAKSIGLSALQIEKRFHYIRKHYDKVTKRLTVDENGKGRGLDVLSNASPLLSMCPGSTQLSLVQKMNEMAQHELDSDRLMKLLINLAGNCRINGEEVVVKASLHQMTKLEACKFFENGVPAHILVDGGTAPLLYLDMLQDVDLIWLSGRATPEPFALFAVDSGLPYVNPALTKWAELKCKGFNTSCFTVVPKGRHKDVRGQLQAQWSQALFESIRGLTSIRNIPEENLEYLLSNPKMVSTSAVNALELLFSISEPAINTTTS